MNQMESAPKLNDPMHGGLMAAQSQILDTDIAAETAGSMQTKPSDEEVFWLLGDALNKI